MKNRILISLLAIIFLNCTPSEDIAIQDLFLKIEEVELLEGEYTGTLEYLDYSDDTRKVTLNMTASYSVEGQKIKVTNRYDEGNGQTVTRTGNYKIKNGLIDGQALREKEINGSNIKIVWLEKGKDGNANKSATFRFTMEGNGQTLSIRKEVLYDGETAYFTRNLTLLEKK